MGHNLCKLLKRLSLLPKSLVRHMFWVSEQKLGAKALGKTQFSMSERRYKVSTRKDMIKYVIYGELLVENGNVMQKWIETMGT